MAESNTPTEAVTTDEEFNTALNALVQEAYANDVDVEGGWECGTNDGEPDWDVVILEVRKRHSSPNSDGT
ncbi:hypothetical protein [Halalkalicoccus jeotgali]|uniref:Uncharacterized protein n=1 Tax=Halalkalicoccus jeotgali (strain DSM 18796 / CECT 7217 / JCM 14584 / KCTC 4019 / B3) TaxID=795797 RepID=D8J9T2_HALJB|nr:hypothetical protein [Halalkalicoccus jeotgali]ADJ16421.1 hypothetical protein HacjB3_15210 [Halalkalicoccus jeotgali B3]ELY37155.1 hypothetical protein C497_10438 [Halalkalicoccus jeotgali B3]